MTHVVNHEIRVRRQRNPYEDLGVKKVRVEVDVQALAQELGQPRLEQQGRQVDAMRRLRARVRGEIKTVAMVASFAIHAI